MGKFDSIQEILDFAVYSEIQAENFYNDLANRSKNPQIADTLKKFALQEAGHKQKLENLRTNIQNGQKFTTDANVTDLKIADYLVDIEPHQDMTYKEILVIAMKKEKAAFKLYSDLANRTEQNDLKNLFLKLAQEEAKHKLSFEIEYDNVVLKED